MTALDPRDSGGIRIFEPPRDGSLVIRGGSTGITFQLAELTGGAEKFDDLAAELEAVQLEIGRIVQDLAAAERLPPWSDAPAVSAVAAAQQDTRKIAVDMRSVSSRIRDCIRDYEMAEFAAGFFRFLGWVSPPEVWERMENFLATRVPDRAAVEQFAGQLGKAGEQPREQDGHPRSDLLDQAAEDAVRPLVSRPVDIERAETVPVELETNFAGLLDRIRSIEARGPGYIEVIEVENGGRQAYVVVVPGTQTVAVGGKNPFDAGGIAEATTYHSEYVTGAVLAALEAAGARPGDPVVAVGYSQGGIHAMNFAADPRVLKQYDVRYVLTAGSPVGGIDAGLGVASLHLEHEADGVPGGDGEPNPDTLERVTVTMTNDVSGGEQGLLGPGHSLANYEDGARTAAASHEPALVASGAVLTGVLGAGGTATATRFALTRSDPVQPARRDGGPGRPCRPFSPQVHRSEATAGLQSGRSAGR